MALYKMSGEKIELINGTPFKLEKEIQALTEKNLQTIFGLKFVKTEFKVNKFRIDSRLVNIKC